MSLIEDNAHLHVLRPKFLTAQDRADLRGWLETIHPLWENRYPDRQPLRHGQQSRRLLRPVYWLGGWQFACLNYYRPPMAVKDSCVAAEPFPPALARLVPTLEDLARRSYSERDVPAGWKLNTCLINFYGARLHGGRWIDSARVRPHKDFEAGPVASLSLGESARFVFVENRYPEAPGDVLAEHRLEDGDLQMFGGPFWKDQTLHGVTQVSRRHGHCFDFRVGDFKTRRVNFTLRYVPEEHIVPFGELTSTARHDISGYVETLAKGSPFFRRAWEQGAGPAPQ